MALLKKISRVVPSAEVGERLTAPAQQKPGGSDHTPVDSGPESDREPEKLMKYVFVVFGALCGVLLALFVDLRIALIGWALFAIISFGMYWLWAHHTQT